MESQTGSVAIGAYGVILGLGVSPAVEVHHCPAAADLTPAVLQTTGGYSAEAPGYNHRLWIEFHLYSARQSQQNEDLGFKTPGSMLSKITFTLWISFSSKDGDIASPMDIGKTM